MAIAYAVGAPLLLMFVLPKLVPMPEPPPEDLTDEDIRREAIAGRKIQAIKWHRHLHGSGLREAKEAVEWMIHQERSGPRLGDDA